MDLLTVEIGGLYIQSKIPYFRQLQMLIQNINSEIAKYCNADIDYETNTKDLEDFIDQMTNVLPKLVSFILPCDTELDLAAHRCRTQTRICEENLTYIQDCEYINPRMLVYMNRLSDFFFTLARYLSIKGVDRFLSSIFDKKTEKTYMSLIKNEDKTFYHTYMEELKDTIKSGCLFFSELFLICLFWLVVIYLLLILLDSILLSLKFH